MLIEKKNIPYPKQNNCEENEKFLKWCFNNGIEGRDIWSKFSYKSDTSNNPINLIGSNLERLNLQGIYLAGAKLGGSNFFRTNLTGSNLVGANLVGANLTEALLVHANLSEVDFFKTNLTNTNFTNSYLKNAYFKDAILSNTIFEKADTEGTNIGHDINHQKINEEVVTPKQEEQISTNEILEESGNSYNPTIKKEIIQEHLINIDNENFVNELHGFIQLKGKIFDKDMDLRDIAFYSKKILTIIDNSFQANNSETKGLKSKFKVTLGSLEDDTLNLNLVLNFGMRLTPLLLNRQTQVWNTASDVIEKIKDLGQCFNNDDINNLQTINNTNSTVELIANNKIITIPIPIYKIMLNICDDLQDLNNKIVSNEVSSIILNEKTLLSFESISQINNGIHIFNCLKLYQINSIYQAQIEVFELNTKTNSGNAIMYKTNFHDALIPDTIPFIIENEQLSTLLNSMQNNTIVVNFKPIVENLINKKILKRIILIR